MPIQLVNWLEIPVADMPRARAFYEALFEAPLHDFEIDGVIYPCFPDAEGEGFAGALVQYDFNGPGRRGPLVYLAASPDLDSMLARIEAAGGSIVQRKEEIAPGMGFMALFEDIEGNLLGLQGDQ